MHRQITFGITYHPERTRDLEILLASLREYYPQFPIHMIDVISGYLTTITHSHTLGTTQGGESADLRGYTPLGGNLSKARNRLIESISTKWVFLIEEDMIVNPELNMEILWDIVEHDRELGVLSTRLLIPEQGVKTPKGVVSREMGVGSGEQRAKSLELRVESQESEEEGGPGQWQAGEDGEIVIVREEPIISRRTWEHDTSYQHNMDRFRGQISLNPPSFSVRISPDGYRYQVCDLVSNVGLFRVDMCKGLAWGITDDSLEERQKEICEQGVDLHLLARGGYGWDEELPLQEHWDFFWRLKQQGQWRVAISQESYVYHTRKRPSSKYWEDRGRVFTPLAEAKNNSRFGGVSREMNQYTNVIVLTPGHTGSSILVKMLHLLGFNVGDCTMEWMGEKVWENDVVHRIEEEFIQTGKFNFERAEYLIGSLQEPWVIKNPRMRNTLHHWSHVTQSHQPLLVLLTRDHTQVLNSFRRRGNESITLEDVIKRHNHCAIQYRKYPFKKMMIDFGNVSEAISQWSPKRFMGSLEAEGRRLET